MASYHSHQHSETVFGLDIGTTKICIVAANLSEDGSVHISGFGHTRSRGMRKGDVIDMQEVVSAIRASVDECVMMSGVPVSEVYVGVSGDHIKLIPSEAMININGDVVTEQDRQRVKDSAQIHIASNYHILHDMEQGYSLDSKQHIANPVGMTGRQLKGKFNIIAGAVPATQNLIRCCQQANLEVRNIVLQPLASSIATLSEDEKQSGVALIDIGGGTTDIMVYQDGRVKSAYVIPLGGDNVTQDIQSEFNVGKSIAQDLKHDHGVAMKSLIKQPDKMVSLPGMNTRQISKKELIQVIEARMSEILEFSLQKLEAFFGKSYSQLNAGLVITGGSVNLVGTEELAQKIFNCPVRRGLPDMILGSSKEIVYSAEYSTAVGLARYGLTHLATDGGTFPKQGTQLFYRINNTMKKWGSFIFNDFF